MQKYYKNNANNYSDEMDSTGSRLTFVSAASNYCDVQRDKIICCIIKSDLKCSLKYVFSLLYITITNVKSEHIKIHSHNIPRTSVLDSAICAISV